MLIKWLHPTKQHAIMEKLGDIFWVNKQKKIFFLLLLFHCLSKHIKIYLAMAHHSMVRAYLTR